MTANALARRSLLANDRREDRLSYEDGAGDEVLRAVITRAVNEIESVFVDTKGRFPVRSAVAEKTSDKNEAA